MTTPQWVFYEGGTDRRMDLSEFVEPEEDLTHFSPNTNFDTSQQNCSFVIEDPVRNHYPSPETVKSNSQSGLPKKKHLTYALEVSDHREVRFTRKVYFLGCDMVSISLFSWNDTEWVVEKELQFYLIFLDKILHGGNRRAFQQAAYDASAKMVVRKKTGLPCGISNDDISLFFEKNTPSLTLWKYTWLEEAMPGTTLIDYLRPLPLYKQIIDTRYHYQQIIDYKDMQIQLFLQQFEEHGMTKPNILQAENRPPVNQRRTELDIQNNIYFFPTD